MHRPTYHIHPADLIDVEVVNPDGSRALVRGRIDAVPETCTGRQALKIVVVATSVRALSPPTVPMAPLRLVPSPRNH
jgi:hypothetical protein